MIRVLVVLVALFFVGPSQAQMDLLTGAGGKFNVQPVASYTTLDPATVTNVTLSGGNLVATNTGTTSADQGAHAPTSAGKTAGKFYFECTLTTLGTGTNLSCGIGTTTSTYTGMGNTGVAGIVVYPRFGSKIFANGSDTGKIIDTLLQGDVIQIAMDLDNRTGWFKKVGGVVNWNGTVGADPATNTGGLSITSGTMIPFVTFGGTSGAAGSVVTYNFGATAFSGAPPTGFAGWTSFLLNRDLNAANDNTPAFLDRAA